MARGSIGNIVMGLSANITGFKSSMAQAGKSLKTFESQSASSTSNIVRSLSGLAAGYVSLQAAVGAAGTAISKTLDFQKGMAEVSTLGVKDSAKLSMAIRNVSKAYGQDLVGSTKAAYQAISAGVSEQNTPKFLEASAKAATAGVSDLTTAVDLGAAVSNAFGKDMGAVSKVFDQAFATVKYGVTTFSELSASAGQLAPTFAAAGLSSEEMFASVGALTKAGIKTSVAFTSMKAAISNVIKPTEDAKDIAKSLGINFDLATLKTMGLSKFLGMLQEKTGGSVEKMGKLFGSTEALGSILALTGNQANDFNNLLDEMTQRTGQTDEAFKVITKDNPAFEIQKMNAAFTDLGIALGTSVAPALSEFAGLITDLLPKSKDYTGEVGAITDAFYEMAAGVNYAMSLIAKISPATLLSGTSDEVSSYFEKNMRKAQERTAEGQQKIAAAAAKKTLETRIAFDKTQAGANASVGVLAPKVPATIAAPSVMGRGGGILSDLMPKPFSMTDGTGQSGKGYIDSLYDSIVTPHIEAGKKQFEMNAALEEEKKKREEVTDEISTQLDMTKEKQDMEAGFTLTKAGRLAAFTPGAQSGGDKDMSGWTPDKANELIGLTKQLVGKKTGAVLA